MSCQLSGKGTAHQSTLVEKGIWWPSHSVLERNSPWRTPCTLTPTPQAASLWSFISKPFTTHQKHVLIGAFPALAQVSCNSSIFTRCPSSQLQFRYANWAACDFSSLPLLPYIWTWLWPSHQLPSHIVVSKILNSSCFLQIFRRVLNVFWAPSSSPMESWHNRHIIH